VLTLSLQVRILSSCRQPQALSFQQFVAVSNTRTLPALQPGQLTCRFMALPVRIMSY
jgi:hypothetical protein